MSVITFRPRIQYDGPGQRGTPKTILYPAFAPVIARPLLLPILLPLLSLLHSPLRLPRSMLPIRHLKWWSYGWREISDHLLLIAGLVPPASLHLLVVGLADLLAEVRIVRLVGDVDGANLWSWDRSVG
jgi:hypothetical protein